MHMPTICRGVLFADLLDMIAVVVDQRPVDMSANNT